MACPASGEVISRNTTTRAALVMISAFRVAGAESRIRMTAGPVMSPAGCTWWKMSGIRRSP
jgi:hypothetical protein